MMTTKPAHVVRANENAGRSQRRKPPAPPVKHYPPGYFTEPVRGNGSSWPPGWQPDSEPLKTKADYDRDAAREIAMRLRVGFAAGGGTVVMPGTPPRRGRSAKDEWILR